MTDYSSCFEINENNNKKLKIVMQQEITTYLNFSLPVCSLLWNKNKYEWIYEHFIKIYSVTDNDFLWLDYLEEPFFYKDIADIKVYRAKDTEKISDIISFIKTAIDNSCYIMIFVDELYMAEKDFYQKKHIPVQILIYGYDDKKKIINTLGFKTNSEFGFMNYSYKEIEKGYEQGKLYCMDAFIWVKMYNIILFKIKNNDYYFFSIENFKKNCESFLKSYGDLSDLRPEIRIEKGEIVRFGMQIYDDIIISLKKLLDDKFAIDYRSIHLLAEHKKLIFKKINFLQLKGYFTISAEEYISEYEKIVREFEKIRMKYLKALFLTNETESIYSQLKNKTVIQSILNSIKVLKNKEERITHWVFDNLYFNEKYSDN